jgi:hypothetical protein
MTHIKDDIFSIDEIYKYALCLKVSPKEVAIGVFNTSNNKYLVYEVYPHKQTDTIEVLEQIYKEHPFIAAGYWKRVILVSALPKYAYVPEEYFSTSNAIDLLRLNTTVESDKLDVCYSIHPQQHINCIFAIEKRLLKWLKSKYPYQETVYLHENSCIIEGLLSYKDLIDPREIYVFAQNDQVTIISFKQVYLQYLNTFAYNASQDLLYYTLLAIEKLGLDKKDAKVTLYGISDESVISQFGKYVSKVNWGRRPQGVGLSYKFDDLKENLAFDMFSIPIISK